MKSKLTKIKMFVRTPAIIFLQLCARFRDNLFQRRYIHRVEAIWTVWMDKFSRKLRRFKKRFSNFLFPIIFFLSLNRFSRTFDGRLIAVTYWDFLSFHFEATLWKERRKVNRRRWKGARETERWKRKVIGWKMSQISLERQIYLIINPSFLKFCQQETFDYRQVL